MVISLIFDMTLKLHPYCFQKTSFPKVVFENNSLQINFYLTSNGRAIVGGKYLRLMDQVGETVSNVIEEVGRRPLAVFFVSDDEKLRSYYDLVINVH